MLDLRKSAVFIPANINIDVQNPGSKLSPSLWRNLAQGGEEPKDMIQPVFSQLRTLQPELIRIDHIFDFYKIDKGNSQYDFSGLDAAVNSILATGAKPMLSLSYTPDSKAPSDWTQWDNLVKATAYHYSVEKNITDIYYEVWNEPDLFGGWHYAKDPNYSTLYIHSVSAVAAGAGSKSYKIGGPAITAFYPNWIKALFKVASTNNLRLDFISWHKYSPNIGDYLDDFNKLNQILSDYPQYFNIERLITETGPDPEPNSVYDNHQSGIHLISLVTQLSGKVHRIFSFEAVDGPSPRSDKSSGWGILTHDQKAKPRYYAFQFLNQLQGQRLPATGDGSYVTSLSLKNGSTIQTLLVNYDSKNSHVETVPINYKGVKPGRYQLKTTQYLGKTSTKTFNVDSPTYTEKLYLDANSAYLLELKAII